MLFSSDGLTLLLSICAALYESQVFLSFFCRYCAGFFFLMIRRPPRSTRTDTPFPTRRSSDLPPFWNEWPRSDLRAKSRSSGCQNPKPGVTSDHRSEEHTSELQSLMRISYAVFCLKKKTATTYI